MTDSVPAFLNADDWGVPDTPEEGAGSRGDGVVRAPGFPAPAARLKAGAVWCGDDVRQRAAKHRAAKED